MTGSVPLAAEVMRFLRRTGGSAAAQRACAARGGALEGVLAPEEHGAPDGVGDLRDVVQVGACRLEAMAKALVCRRVGRPTRWQQQ